MPTDPNAFERRVLLAVTGLSPQVVTETLYALTQVADPGWFHRLCQDYNLPPIRFEASAIEVLPGSHGEPLEDIRTPAENEQAADFITERVRALTADPRSAAH